MHLWNMTYDDRPCSSLYTDTRLEHFMLFTETILQEHYHCKAFYKSTQKKKTHPDGVNKPIVTLSLVAKFSLYMYTGTILT